MELINKWPEYHKKDVVSHYCPGCGHGIVHRIVAELLEEMDLGKEAYLVCPAGCAVLAYLYLEGRGVRRDPSKSFEYNLRAARAGSVEAASALGYALRTLYR